MEERELIVWARAQVRGTIVTLRQEKAKRQFYGRGIEAYQELLESSKRTDAPAEPVTA